MMPFARICIIATLALPIARAEPVTPSQEEEWRNRIRMALFAAGPAPELAPEAHGSYEPAPGVIAERISYGTQFGLRVPAIVYRPTSASAPGPGLIVVNGHGGDKYSWYSFYAGILYARAGAVVLTYDPAGEGERNIDRRSGTRAHDKVEPPTELGQRTGGLMMTDVIQAVSYLSQRPDVDKRRLAAMGYSMGSFVLSVTGAVERRLKAVIMVGGGNLDGPGGYWDNTKPMCQGIPYRTLSFLGDRPAVLYTLHASRGSTLIYNGLEDTTVAIPRHGESHFVDLRERVVKLRGTAAGAFDTGFVPSAGHRPYFVTKPVGLWLERQLDFPNWTEADIQSMPETHIAEWALKNGVELDPLYASEHREGGTRALGTGVPALTREQLSVFTPEEWRRRKDRMIHESWLREARAQIVREANPLEGLRPQHPRLILPDDELERIRVLVRDDPLARRILAHLRETVQKLLEEPPATYELVRGRMLPLSRRTIDRIYTLALMQRLEPSKPVSDRAIAELRAVCAFPTWQDNFLDKGEMIHAVAIGYDWLYPWLSETDRSAIRTALVMKGLRDALPIYQEQRWWAVNRFNWNPVCNGSVTLGALAIAEDEPELARTLLRHMLRSFPLALSSYAPDGGWAEGPEYWHYATRYAAHLLSGLRSALGHDFGLSSSDGFNRAGHFRLHALGPSGRLYNFADAGDAPESTPEMFWLAHRFNEPALALHQRKHLEGALSFSPLDLIWLHPAAPAVERPLPLQTYFLETEVATLRSDWGRDAVFVGVKGGQNRGGRGHAHLDLGSFVLDANGTRWALDLGRHDYNAPDYFGKLRFTYYRTKTESHNTVLIDGADQDIRAEAPIYAHRFEPGLAFVKIDLVRAYPEKLTRFERGVALLQGRHVIVQDEISAPSPVEALWGLITDAAIEIRGTEASLHKAGRTLLVRLLSPMDGRFDVMPTDDALSQSTNGVMRKLVIRDAGRSASFRYVVAMTPQSAGHSPPPLDWSDRDLRDW